MAGTRTLVVLVVVGHLIVECQGEEGSVEEEARQDQQMIRRRRMRDGEKSREEEEAVRIIIEGTVGRRRWEEGLEGRLAIERIEDMLRSTH